MSSVIASMEEVAEIFKKIINFWKIINLLNRIYTCEHDVRVISTGFANSSSQTISCQFFRWTQRMFAAQWVPCLSEFLFSSVFAGRFSYLANNFHITVGTVGPSFSPGLPEVRGKINFPNLFANIIFASGVCECTRSFTFCVFIKICAKEDHLGILAATPVFLTKLMPFWMLVHHHNGTKKVLFRLYTLAEGTLETRRERKCWWKHSPLLGCSRIASGTCLSPQ